MLRKFSIWERALNAAIATWQPFNVPHRLTVKAQQDFRQWWLLTTPTNCPDVLDRECECAEWCNRNFEKVEEWVLDWLIKEGR